jgi:hypothetical protein
MIAQKPVPCIGCVLSSTKIESHSAHHSQPYLPGGSANTSIMNTSRQQLLNHPQGYTHHHEHVHSVPMQYLTGSGTHYQAGEADVSSPHNPGTSQSTTSSRFVSSPCPTLPQIIPQISSSWPYYSVQSVPMAPYAKANPVSRIFLTSFSGKTLKILRLCCD